MGGIGLKKVIHYILIATLILSVNVFQLGHSSAETVDSVTDEIKDLEKQQEALEKEKSELNSEKGSTEDKIEANLDQQDEVKSDLDRIDEKLSTTLSTIESKESEISGINQQISELEQRISDLQAEVDQLKAETEQLKEEIVELREQIQKREKLLKQRVRSIQENGGTLKYLEVLLGAKSFGDFISRVTAVNTIMDQDKSIMDELSVDREILKEKRVEVEKKKQDVEQKKAEVEEKHSEIERQKTKLEEERSKLVSLKSDLDSQMSQRSALLGELEQEQHFLEEYKVTLAEEQEMIAKQAEAVKKAKQIAQEKLENLGDNGDSPSVDPGGAMFIWPAAGNRSSNFGWRIHPIYNVKRFHAGVDVAAPAGTPIYSSGKGTGVVSVAKYHWSYGNHVMIVNQIDGQTYTTNYAHMTRFVVSPGQTVEQGQLIGYVGTTGSSTGNHLHFEIHKGGYNGVSPDRTNAVDPGIYLP